jgi:DNA-binding LytR/AlgR family response regulator
MLRALIIEDEAPARERLATMIADVDPNCDVVGAVDSIAATEEWLRKNPAPDLIFADIQLGDGLSLAIFRAAPPPCPVVFTTAHDDYLLEAFATHGIAYLMKPVKRAELESAFHKYRELGRHYVANLAALAHALDTPKPTKHRQRVVAQRGNTFQPVAIADVAYFFSENKLTFLVTRAGERCLINEPLTTLATELDPAEFFRVNRNFLARASAVKSFAAIGKGRLALQLQPRPDDEVLVSQENATSFRMWAGR